MIHAQLDESGICIGKSELKNIETNQSLVYLTEGWDEDFLWRKWDGSKWSVEKYEPVVPDPVNPIEERIAQVESQNAEILLALVLNDLI